MSKQAIAVKFAEGSEDALDICLVPFGGVFKNRAGFDCDLDGEFFTKSTDLCLDFFPDSRPLLYEHGHDDKVELEIVGRLDSKSHHVDEAGHWFNAQLEKSSAYFSAIQDLVRKGKLYSSSGALSHLVTVDNKTGEIKRWPLIEGSLTPNPANLLADVAFADASKHYKSAGITDEAIKAASFPYECGCDYCEAEIKAKLTTDARNNLSNSDFAYIDSEGGKHLPIHDEAHARNALARFSQTHFESDAKKRSAAKKILAACRKFDIKVSDDSAVAKAAKSFHDMLTLAADDPEALKALMESVDTAGGFLVPEQHGSKPVQKKKATDAADDDEKQPAKAPTDLLRALHELVEQHTTTEMSKSESLGPIVAVQEGDRLVLLTPDKTKAKTLPDSVKAGEVVLASGRHYGDAPEGSIEDWLCDLRYLLNKNLMYGGLFDCMGYVDIIATFGCNGPGHSIVCVYNYDPDDDINYFDVQFDMGDDGDPVITGSTPYAAVYMPLTDVPPTALGMTDDDDDMGKSVLPFKMHGDFMILAAKSFGHRTEGLVRERSKEGRVLSTANRERIAKFLEQWKSVGDDLQTLYDSTAPKAKADLSALKRQMEAVELEFEAHQLLAGVSE